MAVLSWLDQSHTSVPLRITSDSPERAEQGEPVPVGTGVPEPQRVGAGDQGGEVELPDPERPEPSRPRPPMPGRAGSTEVGALHDGAGQAVEAGVLDVDEQLGRGAGGSERGVGLGGDRRRRRRAADDGDDRDAGHGPAQGGMRC